MQLHPGVFVSNVSTEEWEEDAEVGAETLWHVTAPFQEMWVLA
jgi:hypothetical protein